MKFWLLALSLLVGSCTYNAETNVAPAYNVYTSYDNKLDARVALYVKSDELKQDVKVSGYHCSAHTYPVDASKAFRASVVATFENLTTSVQLVDVPPSVKQARAQGYDLVVVVEAEDLDVDLTVIPSFWTAQFDADAEITASLTADAEDGRKLGTTVQGADDAKADAGAACDGGAKAVGEAVENAIRRTMERLGERFANARRLRERS